MEVAKDDINFLGDGPGNWDIPQSNVTKLWDKIHNDGYNYHGLLNDYMADKNFSFRHGPISPG